MVRNRYVYNFDEFTPSGYLFDFLSVDGLGVSIDMNVDGSVTPVKFDFITIDESVIGRIGLIMEDGGPGSDVMPDTFMAMATKLTNGIRVIVTDSDENELIDLLGGETIKSHNEFGYFTGVELISPRLPGMGSEVVIIRWESRSVGSGLRLSPGERFRFIIQDDLTSLLEMRVLVQGVII